MVLVALVGGAAAINACSAAPTDKPTEGATTGSGGGASTLSGGVGGGIALDGGSDAPLEKDAACAIVSAEAALTKRPLDIVLIVDNSGSMWDDILAVQKNINNNFADILAAKGVDYRVIVLSLHGWSDTAEAICIEAPLSATDCNPAPPAPANNPPIFFQYSLEIGSRDSWCSLLGTYDGSIPDSNGLQPAGWSAWLRDDAFKVFVEMSDDGVGCGKYEDKDSAPGGKAAAAAFDADLMALSPSAFGTAAKRNYRWHSIIGVEANSPAQSPWLPGDPERVNLCATGATPGLGYQSLSILTGGLRFPICEHGSYDAVFQEIAASSIASAGIECSFPVPPPPQGQTIDLDVVQIEYTPGGGGPKQTFNRVDDYASCAPGSFYVNGGTIKLCDAACDAIQADGEAKISVLFGCEATPL